MNISLKGGIALFAVIAFAAAIAAGLVATRKPLEHQAQEMPRRVVQTIEAAEIPFRARVTAYGNVEPAITLSRNAEVSGKISYLHPNLKSGETIPAGTLVVRIDAEDYERTLQQTRADLEASRSSLKELEEEEKTTRRSLELARQNLEVGEAEYARVQDIYQQQLVAKSALDAEEQKVIQLRQSVEELQGRMNGYDSRRRSIEAQIARAEQEVGSSETLLGRTEISLPFSARIGEVAVEVDEFVAVGAALFEAIDLKGVEISAQLPITSMRKLVSHLENAPTAGRQFVELGGRVNDALNLSARVRLVNDMPDARWEARVLRLTEAIDVTRQTLGVVVGVDDPYEKVIPGRRPPLLKGMYTAVDIYAPESSALVIPRRALHAGRVYIADAEDRLEIRPVEIRIEQDDLVLLRSGIAPGERLIITDLVPVIDGMPLSVIRDTDYEASMRERALGIAP